MSCCFYSVPPPNEKSKILKKILVFLLFCQACLAAAKWFFIVSKFEFAAEIIAICVLFQAMCQLNYCNCVVYILLCLMNCSAIIMRLARQMQAGVELTNISTEEQAAFLWVSAGSLVFYVVSIYFALQSYREFKGISYDILLATYNHEASAFSLYNSPHQKSKKQSKANSEVRDNNNHAIEYGNLESQNNMINGHQKQK